jgi:golgi phosphoprotein 3
MTNPKPLFLYEEIMLLALSNDKGTILTSYPEYNISGAILAELLLEHRISIDRTQKQLVTISNPELIGDPIIDECLEKMVAEKSHVSLQTWTSRFAGIKDLNKKVARQLCNRGILRADEDKVMFFFKRNVYPEVNPAPEQEIIDRVRTAIFTDEEHIDPRTVVLISLANSTNMLNEIFECKEVANRKQRIEQIVNGEITGKATEEIIAACQIATIVTTMTISMSTTMTQ